LVAKILVEATWGQILLALIQIFKSMDSCFKGDSHETVLRWIAGRIQNYGIQISEDELASFIKSRSPERNPLFKVTEGEGEVVYQMRQDALHGYFAVTTPTGKHPKNDESWSELFSGGFVSEAAA